MWDKVNKSGTAPMIGDCGTVGTCVAGFCIVSPFVSKMNYYNYRHQQLQHRECEGSFLYIYTTAQFESQKLTGTKSAVFSTCNVLYTSLQLI